MTELDLTRNKVSSENLSKSPKRLILDDATKRRLSNLAAVGTALYESIGDNSQDTIWFSAKESLFRFQEDIMKTDMNQISRDGMRNLIAFLNEEIDRRMERSKRK